LPHLIPSALHRLLFFVLIILRTPSSTLFPYTTLFRSLNFGECPNVVEESGLWQILEANVPQKYFLSETACLGVLRRAERRGKKLDRKSTRLNSSHVSISYAVFCLKKKNRTSRAATTTA